MTTFPEGERLSRPSCEALDSNLGLPEPVLDHGFIRIIDYMGDEAAIVQAARVSYGQGTQTPSDDRGLLRYLMRHRHSTPFEMCEIKLHVKLPTFVARQWIRHRTANVNEISARYSILSGEFYMPEGSRLGKQSTTNKQGTAQEGYDSNDVLNILGMIESVHGYADDTYRRMVDGDLGSYDLSRELARIVLPVSTYTEWYWKVDLHNLLHFLSLRADPHAQWEIRQYADVICKIIEAWMPNVWEAFVDYRLQAHTFSRQEMDTLRNMIDRGNAYVPSGANKREIAAFRTALGLKE